MNFRDTLSLIILGALWGASFLFIRIAAPEFGPIALIEVRVVLACAVLLPLVAARRALPEIIANWRPIMLMGLLHYALPFCLFAFSMLTLTGGFSAVINASSSLFAGVMAWILLGERLSATRLLGLVVGFAGVVVLVWDRLAIGSGHIVTAIAASVLAAFFYGYAAVLARQYLSGVSPIAVSAGSMAAAAVLLLPAALWLWPDTSPTVTGWSMAGALGVFCTAMAFLMYFRLIANIGPTRAITVAYLIPVFAVFFGAVFLDEAISPTMLIGGLIVLTGTSLSTGLVSPTGLLPRWPLPQGRRT